MKEAQRGLQKLFSAPETQGTLAALATLGFLLGLAKAHYEDQQDQANQQAVVETYDKYLRAYVTEDVSYDPASNTATRHITLDTAQHTEKALFSATSLMAIEPTVATPLYNSKFTTTKYPFFHEPQFSDTEATNVDIKDLNDVYISPVLGEGYEIINPYSGHVVEYPELSIMDGSYTYNVWDEVVNEAGKPIDPQTHRVLAQGEQPYYTPEIETVGDIMNLLAADGALPQSSDVHHP